MLPKNVQDALDKYDADVAAGRITFNDAGFAITDASGDTNRLTADADLVSFVNAHVSFMDAS